MTRPPPPRNTERSPALRPPKTKDVPKDAPVVGYRLDNTPAKPTGRMPSSVAVACRLGFEQRIALLEKIADGKVSRVNEVATPSGRVVLVRVQPTITERLRAIELLGKAGRVMSDEPLAVDHPVAAKLDFSKYTSEELMQLEALLAKGLRTEDVREPTSLPPSATNGAGGR